MQEFQQPAVMHTLSGSIVYGATFKFQKSKMVADGYLGYTKMAITSHATGLQIDLMFGSRVGFLNSG